MVYGLWFPALRYIPELGGFRRSAEKILKTHVENRRINLRFYGLKRDRNPCVFTHFSSRQEGHGLQTAQAAALGNTAFYLAERKTCATLPTTVVRIVVISSDLVAAILTLLKLHCCDYYSTDSYVLLMKS